MSNIREIYTKAIVGKGKKISKKTYCFNYTEDDFRIIGTFVSNHHFEAIMKNNSPCIVGTYDLFIWGAVNNMAETKVIKQQITYIDEMKVNKKENRDYEESDLLKARCLEEPQCLSIKKEDENIYVEIEKEMQIEISGETCIRVETKEESETWDEFEDIEINPHFIHTMPK